MSIGEGIIGREVTNSSLQLVFLYDPLNKKVVFASLPLTVFFNGSINMPEESILPQIICHDKESTDEWQSCLQLKEHQSHEFTFAAKQAGEKDSRYHCQATGIRVAVSPSPFYICFFVRKELVEGNGDLYQKTEKLQRMADSYRNEVSEFTEVAAHDLDAPLRKLNVLIDRVTEKIGDDSKVELQPYLDRISTCLSDMRSLVDGLASLSRHTTRAMGYVSCNTGLVVDGIIKELQPIIDQQHATITVSDLPVIEGDQGQLKQLFRNLLENALRFGKKAEAVRIRIKGQPAANEEKGKWGLQQDKSYFHIEVEDNGIGFDQEHAEKLFKPFVRLRGKSEFPGSGLGLAVCKRIVNNHNGIIYAEGKEETGARFVVLLPQTLK